MKYWDSRKDLIGLSTETKPTDEIDGTTFYEVDTGAFFIFYQGEWYEQGESSETNSEEIGG